MSNTEGPWSHPPPRRPPPPNRRVRLIGLAIILALVAAAISALALLFPGRLTATDDWGMIARNVGFLVLAASALLSMRLKLRDTLRYALIWAALAGLVVIGFTYKAELAQAAQRLRTALIPGYAVPTGEHSLALGQDAQGAYHVVGQVDGHAIDFLVDTGASDIVLSPADAQRIGVDMAALRYTRAYETANGEGEGASYVAPSLIIGPIKLTNVAMSINRAPMNSSLLGMSFLKRIESYEFKGGQLILKWRG